MSIKPMLFNTEMVQAIEGGHKTVTRRAVKPQPEARLAPMMPGSCYPGCFAVEGTPKVIRPPCQTGDILWGRETWSPVLVYPKRYIYKADAERGIGEGVGLPINWRPSIHMPKEAARLFLRVTNVRAERLRDIDGRGVLAEGVDNGKSNPSMKERWENMQRMAFSELWDSTVKPADLPIYGWAANPWVWVIEFERCGRPEGFAV